MNPVLQFINHNFPKIVIGLWLAVYVLLFYLPKLLNRRRYHYGSFGSGRVFWHRLLCRHHFESVSMDGSFCQCSKCGLYRVERVTRVKEYDHD